MAQKFSNNARALLTSAILAGDTSIPIEVSKADSFPVADTGTDPVPTVGKDYFKAVLQDTSGNIEIVYVRSRTGGAAILSNVIRGQEGTTARAFASGSVVGLRMTAADLQVAVTNDASGIVNTPAGGIAATNVQAAINELDTEKSNVTTTTAKTSNTGSAVIPFGTTAQRDGVPLTGYFRYNTTLAAFEGYSGTAWGSVGGGATGAAGETVFVENSRTVNTSYSISVNKSASMVGPLVVATGQSTTVQSNQRLVVL